LTLADADPTAAERDSIESQIERIDQEMDGLDGERDALSAARSRRVAGQLMHDAERGALADEHPLAGSFDADFAA
jgi:hypothetical protein